LRPYGWANTLDEAFALYPETSLILNAGDFVDSPDKESEYDAYFEPEILASYPTATAVGNHDVAVNYRNHFNEPNLSEYGMDEAGSDYYFTYGNVLYMVLNANNLNNEEHVQFLQETAAATADPVGKPPEAAAACVACHGTDGIGIIGQYPTLSGQYADYLERALHDYKRGNRKNEVMAGFVGTLTETDIAALAAYYSQQQPKLEVIPKRRFWFSSRD